MRTLGKVKQEVENASLLKLKLPHMHSNPDYTLEGTVMTAHNSIFMGPIKAFGTTRQKQDILPQFVTGGGWR